MSRIALLLSLSLSICACGKRPVETIEAAPFENAAVPLEFAWPASITGLIKREQSEQKNDDPAELTSVVYSITAHAVANGTQVEFSDPRDFVVPGVSAEEVEAVKPMFEAVPTIKLENGAVVSIGNTDKMRALIDEIAPIPEDASPEMRAKMLQVRTDEFFLHAAKAEWWTLTTMWAGQSLVVGQPVRSTSKMQIMMLPKPIDTHVMVSLDERLKCPGAPDRDCVRLTYTSKPDPKALAEALSWMSEEANRKGQKFEIEELNRETRTELVTEPSTLLPHWFSQTETTLMKATQDGQPIAERRVKRRTEKYEWN